MSTRSRADSETSSENVKKVVVAWFGDGTDQELALVKKHYESQYGNENLIFRVIGSNTDIQNSLQPINGTTDREYKLVITGHGDGNGKIGNQDASRVSDAIYKVDHRNLQARQGDDLFLSTRGTFRHNFLC